MTRFVEPAVLACPICESPVLKTRLASFNDFGAVYWSDNYASIVGLGSTGPIVCCPVCEGMFWTEDAKQLGIMPKYPESLKWSWLRRKLASDMESVAAAESAWKSKPDSWDWAGNLQQPRGRELLWALEHVPGSNQEREIFIRTKLWWAGNAPLRGHKSGSPMTTDQEQQNMAALLKLKRGMPPEKRDLLLEGELLREMGCFEEAISILEAQVTIVGNRAAIPLAKAREKDPVVCEVGRSQFDF
ncbi:MAG: hypothetical protein JNK92_11840 [Dechloromonas sp.]|nr:hypothetical protein [Dechloromonas sp.]